MGTAGVLCKALSRAQSFAHKWSPPPRVQGQALEEGSGEEGRPLLASSGKLTEKVSSFRSQASEDFKTDLDFHETSLSPTSLPADRELESLGKRGQFHLTMVGDKAVKGTCFHF